MSLMSLLLGLKGKYFKSISLVLPGLIISIMLLNNISAQTYMDIEYKGNAIPIIVSSIVIDKLKIRSDGNTVLEIIPPENVSEVSIIIRNTEFVKLDATLLDFIKVSSTAPLKSIKIEIDNLNMPKEAFIRNLIHIGSPATIVEITIRDSVMSVDNIVYYNPSLDYYPRDVNLKMFGAVIRRSLENQLEDLFYSTQLLHVSYHITNSTIFGNYYSSSSGGLEVLSVHRRTLLNRDNLSDALGISLTTITVIGVGVYIEHRIRKQEKIEEMLEES